MQLQKKFNCSLQYYILVSLATFCSFTFLSTGESSELGARIVELPYSGNDISMVLLLPIEEGTQAFTNMVLKLNSSTLNQATSFFNFVFTNVQLQLPKFKLEHLLEDQLIMVSVGGEDGKGKFKDIYQLSLLSFFQ